MEDLFKIRYRRLRELVQTAYDNNQRQFALAIDKTPAYVNFLLNDPELPHHKNLGETLARHIERKAGLPDGWLDKPALGAVRNKRSIEAFDDGESPEGYVMIERRRVTFAAGAGSIATEVEAAPPLAFRQSWLSKEGLVADKLVLGYANGDSMLPRIHDGDTLLIDTAFGTLRDGKIYALRVGDELRVKRVFRRTSSVVLHSDNPDFPSEELTLDEAAALSIIGRVVWVSGTL